MAELLAPNIITAKRSTSQQELDNHARLGASGLAEQGIGEGDAVALLMRNDFAFFEAAFAANYVGAYAVPINWHFQSSEINYILGDSEAKVLIAHSDLLQRIVDRLPPDILVIQVPTPDELVESYQLDHNTADCLDFPQWHEWIRQFSLWDKPQTVSRTNTIYTSGTTGKPKGVVREPEVGASAEGMQRFLRICFGFSPGDSIRTVVTGPVYHSAPNGYAINAIKSGGFVALQERFNALQLLEWVERFRITHLHMVPTMFVRLLALGEEDKRRYDLSSLEFVTHAAAPCSPVVKQAMIEWWGPIIHEYYGGTETGGVTACTSAEALLRPGTVGRAIESAEVRILNDLKQALPAGEVGEIFMRHHGYPDFTYKNRQQARHEVEHEGLISIGDLGYLDSEGYLFICDRIRDMVISGGVNIYPAEIEGEILQLPEIKDCAVFGIPHPEYGESLCAYIQLKPDTNFNENQLLTALEPRMARYKLPKKIVFVDDLPREDSGKIFKRKIREPYWQEREAVLE